MEKAKAKKLNESKSSTTYRVCDEKNYTTYILVCFRTYIYVININNNIIKIRILLTCLLKIFSIFDDFSNFRNTVHSTTLKNRQI